MKKYGICTAEYRSFDQYSDAKRYLDHVYESHSRVVIKVDGLAAGKGVVLPANHAEAQHALYEIMVDEKFGSAGQSVVIEDFLEGDEISVLTFCDGGDTFVSLPPGQDHKRILDGNRGLNTGGMGVYAPLPFMDAEMLKQIDRDLIKPTLDGLKAEGEYSHEGL
jgi:phosphoribosylamine-glycine ligase